MKVFKEIGSALRSMRNFIGIFFLIYLIGFCLGILIGGKGALGEYEETTLEVAESIFEGTGLTKALEEGNIFKITLIIFSLNLIHGAFLTTTLSGLLLFPPFLVAGGRAVLIGGMIGTIIRGGMEFPAQRLPYAAFTFFLEFSAYILSSAAGAYLGYSLIKGKGLKKAFIEVLEVYGIIIPLLLAGAIVESLGVIAT
jgi:hypothetical protein